ncbi:MAG TPA: ATP-binding protein [Cellvibrio sp.]|nr:ATP-binding protein [Cellvibrio sp.]
MDGRKSQLTDSLQFRLSLSAALAIVLVAMIAGMFSYWWSFEEAIEVQDEQLIQLAALVNHQRIAEPDSAADIEVSKIDPESHFVVQWLDTPPGQFVELPDMPADLDDGLQTRLIQGQSWRLFVKKVANGRRVAVAQQTEVRDEFARTSALNTLIPLAVLIPLLLIGVAYSSRWVFAPLKKMAMQLDSRSDSDLTSLPEENLAAEIAPFVRAINRLLQRISEFVEQQRKFTRDAAHELRSPLTAISLQTERLLELSTDAPLHSRLINLHKATERTRILIEQLLISARVQQEAGDVRVVISLKELLREVLEDLLPLAEVKVIDISVEGEDIQVRSQAIDLHILIKNLVENAIRYSPPSAKIGIFLRENSQYAELVVQDNGPGICSAEQERVFDPFYRVAGNDQPGSGLGLTIVRTIASRLGLKIALYNNTGAGQSGLSAQVIFPKQST